MSHNTIPIERGNKRQVQKLIEAALFCSAKTSFPPVSSSFNLLHPSERVCDIELGRKNSRVDKLNRERERVGGGGEIKKIDGGRER